MSSGPTIRVRHLNGEEYPTTISLDETIGALKEKVEAASSIPAVRQRLIYKGKEVHNHVQLAAAGLSDGSVIHLVERLIAPTAEGQTAPSAGAQPQGQAGAGVFAGPGLEAVNAIVSQVVGGLLGPTATHGSQPASPRTPRRRRRAAPPLNGLVALHGYLSRLSDLQSLDDPPAMLPVVRTGLPDSHHSWNSVTSATTAVLNSNRQRHGSLQDALVAATGDSNISSGTVEQLDALLQRAVAQQQQRQQDAQQEGATPGPLAGEPSRGPGVSAPATEAAASQAAGASGTEAAPSDTYEFMQLVVLAYALTMAQAAESMRMFEASFTERAASLARDVLRDVQEGSTTFERSQVHMERLGTIANRMSGLAVETAYLCGLFANAVRGDHRMLTDGMHPVVLMTDHQHSRALQHAATIMPQAFPSGQAATASASPASGARPSPVDAIPRISINPGFAPMLVGSSSLRRIMPTRATTARASTATTSGGSGSPGGTAAAEDPGASAAWNLLQGILGSTADVSQVMGGLPGDPMTSPLTPTMQAGTTSGASGSGAAAAQDPSSVSVPAHSSEQQVQDLPIFNQDTSTAGPSMASAMPGMPLAGIHISSSIVTGDLPFRNAAAPEGGAAGGAGTNGGGPEARSAEGMPNPDDSTDVGGMIIQLELPQDGGSVTSIQTAGIGQLGSVLQNMMQEQLAFARERIRDLGGNAAGSDGAAGPGAAPSTAAPGAPSSATANPDASTRAAGTADRPPSRGGPSSTSALSLPTQVLRLTQQLVSDVRRQQSLPEQERGAEAARLTREYLQQVPDMLRQALPQVAAGVDEFLQRGQTSDAAGGTAPAGETAPSAPAATAPTSAPAPDPVPAAPVATPAPAAPAPPAPADTPDGAADSKAASGSGTAKPKVADEARASDVKGVIPGKQFSAGASTSSAAAAGALSSAGPSQAGPSLPKRPEPKGLAGGLKPRKPRSSGAAAAAAGAAPRSAPVASSAVVPSAPVGADAGGGAGAGGSGGSGSPLDMLLPLMQSPQMQGMAQQMMSSPQMQGVAEQMSSGNADLGSLMQSMMPMVSSMLGGGPPGQDPSGTSASRGMRSAGAGSSQASSMPSASSAEMKAMLVQQLGPEEAARWQKVMKEDKGAMQRSGKSTGEHSSAYTAGSTRDAEGDKGFMF